MVANTVLEIRNNNLCCSCGICKNVCPVGAIKYVREEGTFVPDLSDKCVSCGKCLSVCPSVCHNYSGDNFFDAIVGEYFDAYNVWSKDEKIRHFSASSGFVTTMVKELLNKREYEYVFTLDTYDYSTQLKTNKYDINSYNLDDISAQKFTKSRYLPVSHENLVEYIIKNKESKVIIIGTPCALRGIDKVIKKFGLNRENYLFIGLFCEMVMNYNVYDYFSNSNFSDDKTLSSLHFKNKDSGGWPGNMKLFFSDGSFKYIDKDNRVNAKHFFELERCLYCIDKLNVVSDISVGDNYTSQNSTSLGSNSVIIRTKRGEKAFKNIIDKIGCQKVDIKEILSSQYLSAKEINYNYSLLKKKTIGNNQLEINSNFSLNSLCDEYIDSYKLSLKRIEYGKKYKGNIKPILKETKKIKSGHNFSFVSRLKRYIKRSIISK